MSKFSYDIAQIEGVKNQISTLQSELTSIHSKLNSSKVLLAPQTYMLVANSSSKDAIKTCIQAITTDMQNVKTLQERLGLLKSTLDDIDSLVTGCEDNALFNIEGYKEYDGDSPAFDDEGQYGGDQGSVQYAKSRDNYRFTKAFLKESTIFGMFDNEDSISEALSQEEFTDLKNIVHKYYPNMSNKEIQQLLENINDGCRYIALTNTIYDLYEDNPEEFEKTFGFSMYKNGDLNYNALIVDFYVSKGNISNGGTNFSEGKKFWESYCAEHGISTNVKILSSIEDFDLSNFQELQKKGQIIAGVFDSWSVRNVETGKVYEYTGGHAICITDITSDGKIVVSSWGEKYYLELNEQTSGYFYQVQYK